MATYLDRILSAHRAASASDRRDLAVLEREALAAAPARGFKGALLAARRPAVIAEVKRASPLKGPLSKSLDPASLAAAYERGGAAAISVLTDSTFFEGSAADLQAAREAVELPVLRKDFTVCPADVYDARLMGADAVLLIVAALSVGELQDLLALSAAVGLDALVEAHDEAEAQRALDAGASLIGVNQRDLVSFDVDPERALRVAKELPAGICKVAESGISSTYDVRRLAEGGFDAVLVGEALVRSADPEAAVRALCS
jgi:indole-3-glycerol phosphate synthase